jgi:hypothetical protein
MPRNKNDGWSRGRLGSDAPWPSRQIVAAGHRVVLSWHRSPRRCRQRVTEPGSATVVGLRHGWDWPPAPAVPHRQAQPRSPPGVRLGRRPSHGDGGGPEAPAYRKTSYEAASAFAGEPEVYRGAFVRLIVKSSASLASRSKLPPGKGRAEWASTLPILAALHRLRTAAVWEIPGTRYRPRRRRAGIRGFP